MAFVGSSLRSASSMSTSWGAGSLATAVRASSISDASTTRRCTAGPKAAGGGGVRRLARAGQGDLHFEVALDMEAPPGPELRHLLGGKAEGAVVVAVAEAEGQLLGHECRHTARHGIHAVGGQHDVHAEPGAVSDHPLQLFSDLV